MPDISLLEPMVLRGVVAKQPPPDSLTLLNRVPQSPWPYPSATWDVIRGSRMVAKPNVPNSEAHIVPRLGRSQESAYFVYLREKKVFEPTTIHWLRTPGQMAATNAEAAVLREVTDLNMRFDNFAEICLWGAMMGKLELEYADVVADVDYKFSDSHLPAPAVPWNAATPTSITADIRAWKQIVARDGRVAAKEAFATEGTLSLIFDSFANSTTGAAGLLSDNMKDEYFKSGTLNGFMGLQWNVVDEFYEEDDGVQSNFVPDGALFLGNYTDNRPLELLIGPSADDEAPDGYTGKFAKSWKDPDPSARQYLLEWSILPVVTRPEQMVFVEKVGDVGGGGGSA